MKWKNVFEITGNGIMYILSVTQTKELFEIISLVLSILISVLILVSHIIAWFKKANYDGKITGEELDELTEIIEKGKEDLEKKEK